MSLSELSTVLGKFFYFSVLSPCILGLSIILPKTKNPVYALLILIGIFLFSVIFLLAIQVQFLALIYLIVYIGAIAILFLFVLMMFNLKQIKIVNGKIFVTF